MSTEIALIDAVKSLYTFCPSVTEDMTRLILDGNSLDESSKSSILNVIELAESQNIPLPMLYAVGTGDPITLDNDDLESSDFDGEPWRLVLDKAPIANLFSVRENETTLLFFSLRGFDDWAKKWDPFLRPSASAPDLSDPTTIRVHGLNHSFGGPLLWVLPVNESCSEVKETSLPESSKVHSLIHTNSTKALRVCPKGYSLTWGEIDSPEALSILRISARVMAACLVQELRFNDECYEITINGTKRLSLSLYFDEDYVNEDFIRTLNKVVEWVYDEKPETRLGLIMDRLSIDVDGKESFLSGLRDYLYPAFFQAKDSYSFVILERKDAYHKEVRELMKDMKSQADLYAQKVRDLVSSITRDALGILVFITFFFIARFDKNNFLELLNSAELSVISKVMACYLVVSFLIQFSAHKRDVTLSGRESDKWLDMLQHYSSKEDKENRFLEPIRARRQTFYIALFIAAVIYVLLAVATWNLPSLISWLVSISAASD